jgi:hypothetical protein
MSLAGAVTPPPPDVLHPPNSPFRVRSEVLDQNGGEARASGTGGGAAGRSEGEEDDWDMEAEMEEMVAEEAEAEEKQEKRVSMYVKLFDGASLQPNP